MPASVRLRGYILLCVILAGGAGSAKAQNATVPLRINSGGWSPSFTDAENKTWLTDRYYTGGANIYYAVNPPLNRFALYSSSRRQTFGDVVYRIPLANGNYRVTLHFIENQFSSAGQRVFNVLAQGAVVLPNFDVRAQVAFATPLVRPLASPVNVANGILELIFRGVVGSAQVAGIEVEADNSAPVLAVSPASLNFASFTGVNPATQNLSVTNTGGGALNWTASSDQPWLTVTPGGSAPGTVTASVNVAGLAAAAHNANITVTAAGAQGSPKVIPVALTLTPPPVIGVSPPSLSFTATQGGSNPAAQGVTISNAGGGTLTWSASSNQPWLILTPGSNSVSAAVSIAGLAPNTYNGAITISSANATNSPQTIPVTLTVNPAPPTIGPLPPSLTFTGVLGGSNPSPQVVNVTNTGGGTLNWTVSSNQPWLTVTPGANSFSAAVSLSGLSAATHSATITVTAAGATNTPRTIPVSLTVTAPPTIGPLPPSLTFTGTQGGSNPAAQTVNVTNTGGGTLNWTVSSNQPWLTVTPGANSFSAAVSLSGLAVTTHSATITVTAAGATNTPQTIPVTLTVTAPPPTIGVSPTSLTFTGQQGGADPPAQALTIANTGGGTLNWTAVSNQPWLTLTAGANSVSAAVSLTGLAPGTHSASIAISAAGASNTPRTVPVTLTVLGPPAIGVSPGSLTFSATQGGSNPAAQTLTITNTGGGTLSWTAASNQPWLTLTPGTNSVSAAVSLSGLAAGTHNATIAITATGASNSPLNVPVTLTISSQPTFQTLRINPGGWSGTWVDSAGVSWLTDRYFTSGYNYYAPYGTPLSAMLSTARIQTFGDLVYRIPVPNADYQVKLHFIEMQNSAVGARRFNVLMNGSTALSNLDVRAEAGFATPLMKTLPVVTVTGGQIELIFRGTVGAALVNGIEVAQVVSAPPSPAVSASPTSLTFAGTQGGSNPSAQVVNISNTGGGTLNWTATSNQPWLTLTPSANSVSAAVSLTGLAPNTYSATITITAPGATNTPQTVPVTLTVNATPPSISANPTSLAFTGIQGGSNPAAQVVAVNNTGGGTLNWTATSNQPWLTLTPSANSVSAAVSLTGLAPNTYNATITITAAGATNTPQTVPVTLTVSAAPPTISASPTSLTFTGTQGGSNPAAQVVNISNTGGGTLNWTATSNQPWLTLTPSANSVSAAVSLTGLAPNTYNATITITASGATNTPQTVPVTLTVNAAPPTISPNPASLTFTGTQGGSNPAAQVVNISNTGGGTLNWTATSNQPWLTLTPSANSVSAAVSLTGLAPNTYNATITIAATGATNTPQTVPVTLTVSAAPPTINPNPTSLTFTGTQGGSNPAAQVVNISNTGGGTLNWTATSNQPWLTLTPSTNSVSAAISLTGLAPNTYNATITITAPGATNTPQTVPVTLTVNATPPTISANPTSLAFTGIQGGSNPAAQVVAVNNTGGGTLNWTATSNQPWLTLTPSANSVSAAVSLTGLAPNTYNATITITAPGATNTPQTVPVTLTVNADPPTITPNPTSLTFTGTQGGSNPPAQVVNISNTGGGTLNWTATSDQPWLTLTPSANSVSAAVSLTGLAPNTYNATITITAPGATNTPQTVPVTLTVNATPPTISANPTSLTFTGTQGGSNPAAQVVNISNTGGGTLNWTATSNQPWLTLTPSANSVSAAVSLTGLAPNTYNAIITIAATGATNTPQTVPVTLTVNADPPTITPNPTSLTFTGTQGGSNPPAQVVNISNTGGGTLNWTATSDQPWLTLTPSANSVSAAVSLTGLAPNTYNATITITAPGATNTPQTVPVTLTVNAAPPTISPNPTSLSFTGTQGGSNPATQIVNISNTGGGTLNWTATSNQPWLTLTPSANSVSAAVSLAGLAPNTYNATITIAATGATNTPQTIPVTLTVSAAAPPTISPNPTSLTFTGTQGGSNPAAQVVNISNTGGGTLNWTATSDQPWLTLTPSANSVSAAVSLTGLAPNTYNAIITIAATGATNTPQTVPVTLTVSASQPTIGSSPSTLSFTGIQGGTNPAPQTLNISNTGGGTLNWTATSSQPWLTLIPSANSISANVNLAGLNLGYHSANIVISAPGATNSPQSVFIGLSVTTPTPTLIADPLSVSQFSTVNGPLSSGQPITVSNTGPGTINWTVTANQPWINLTTAAGTASVPNPGVFVVRSDPTGLSAATYSATVTVTSPGLPPQVIPVTFTVSPQPTLTVSPSAVTFSGLAGGPIPPAQPVYAVNGGGGTLTWSASTDAAWLNLTTNPGNVFARPNTTGLAAGTYSGNITFTAPGAVGSPRVVPVTFNVSTPEQPTIDSTPSSLTFTHIMGGSRPQPRLLSLFNRGLGAISWTASSNQPWLSTALASGSTPTLLSISVQPAGLTAGSYTGNVTLNSTAGTGSSKVVAVTLDVVDPTPLRHRYAAPNGSPTGDGSIGNPWDLYTALFYNYALQPGDTLWVRGGVYSPALGYFNSILEGTPTRPIIVRQYPGERAIVEGGIYLYGSNTWLWGFELRGLAAANRSSSTGTPGLEVFGVGSKVINMLVHDNHTGVNLWRQSAGAEAYGNLIFNFGYQGLDRGHGHAMYTQNETGLKTIHDNVVFHGFGFGLHGYGTDASSVRNYDVEGNISFNNGVIGTGRPHNDNLFFSGGLQMQGIRVENNYTYHTIADNQGTNQFGFGGTGPHLDLVLRGNYFIGGNPSIYFSNWQDIDFRNNVIHNTSGWAHSLSTEQGQLPQRYVWDFNSYHVDSAQPFRLVGPRWSFGDWKTLTNADPNSVLSPSRPTGVNVFVRPNKYEAGRAHVAVYNWSLSPTVSVDLSSVLSPGNVYEIRNAVNPLAAPVATGTYTGAPVSLPMTGLTAATVTGTNVPNQPVHPGPEFGVFLVIKTGP